MIPLALAVELKQAGLVWRTQAHDFFAIPDHALDDRVFVLADMVAFTELVQGWPAVAFHGAAEWALDYIFTHEIVWLPTEEQLREVLKEYILRDYPYKMVFSLECRVDQGYTCVIAFGGEPLSFAAPTAGEAYARALLHVLRQYNQPDGV